MKLTDRLQQYLRDNFDKQTLQDQLSYDNAASVLLDVAKKHCMISGEQHTEEELHTIVKQAIDNFMNSDAANGEGQDKAHNLGKGQDPNDRFKNIVDSVNVKYY